MPKLKSFWASAFLLTCAACSSRSEIESPPPVYVGIPAGLMERCEVRDVELVTTADLIESRRRYKEGFDTCAARVDAIREHDRRVRGVVSAVDAST